MREVQVTLRLVLWLTYAPKQVLPPSTTPPTPPTHRQTPLFWTASVRPVVAAGQAERSQMWEDGCFRRDCGGFESMEGGRKTEPDGSKRESGRATEHEARLSLSLSLRTNSQTPKKRNCSRRSKSKTFLKLV